MSTNGYGAAQPHNVAQQHDLGTTADEASQQSFSLVVVSGGSGDPSSTRRLAGRIAYRVAGLAGDRGHPMTTSVIELRELATEIATAIVSGLHGPKLTRATELLKSADALIASSPVYKAGASGLFSSFFHVLDNDLLIAKPVILAATAESSRHALVIDDGMRPLFAYLRTLVTPTSVFAAPQDWADPDLNFRIDRAALELVVLAESGFAAQIRSQSWSSYQHEYGSAGGTQLSVDLESDLMRLATGGSAQN